jgi:glycosyltransferase involved in cell wall biosynthesis
VIITYAGRLIKEKGVLNLLQAFMLVKKDNPDFKMRLVIAGDGDLLGTIQRNYTNQSIDMLGRIDFAHVMALFKRTDIFVYPSLYPEGLPTSILEAGLMDCAVVATPRGGTEEVIVDSRHGIITDGSVESLQKSLERLVASSNERRKLARTLKRRVEKVFNWDAVAKEVDRQINGLNTE